MGAAPGPPPGALLVEPTGALERAPGPHAVKRSARYARSAFQDTIYSAPGKTALMDPPFGGVGGYVSSILIASGTTILDHIEFI